MEEDLASEADSVESVVVERILEMVEDGGLCYRCSTNTGEEIMDRSDLMDGSTCQRMVLAFEKRNPPPWDDACPICDGEDCEECECPDCERTCRFFRGVNYGCEKHPVV